MNMRERKYVKFRVDMYEDTKFKIIDRMRNRDLIHYVWNRVVVLAGKVNQEGELYMSRNIPYTVETLSIEFNRDISEVKSALDVLINLEMIEIVDNNIYKVKNFVKHQNIKVKEKNEIVKKENEVKIAEDIYIDKNESIEVSPKNVIPIKEKEEVDTKENKDNEIAILKVDDQKSNRENESDDNSSNVIEAKKEESDQHNNSPVIFEVKKNSSKKKKRVNKKNNESDIESYDEHVSDNITDRGNKDNDIFWFSEGEIILGEGERTIAEWSFD
ncbi:replication protein [Clostridium sp. MF28]|uniref:phage replisome organizer N-terminal domain-containing protein n=1 Tax=Clostridium TaxID=1485 RepID=UPI000CF8FE1B|nr:MULTISPECIES: phage replisome organizer N-terminal domain-containing protein [Clostridium]AVK48287.1 replication protein [Clostridium sp. MF28]PSM56103.1 replication protein [Clostridium diolis]